MRKEACKEALQKTPIKNLQEDPLGVHQTLQLDQLKTVNNTHRVNIKPKFYQSLDHPIKGLQMFLDN